MTHNAESICVQIRMQQELYQSLARCKALGAAAVIRWGMVIDRKKCVGCHACTVACITENTLPEGVIYRPVSEEEKGVFPHVARIFTPRLCRHCAQPPCVPVCPTQATWQEHSTGIVQNDVHKCVGCGHCVKACPYGARVWYKGHKKNVMQGRVPSTSVLLGNDIQRAVSRADIVFKGSVVQKCHFCAHRISQGMLPACVTSCVGRATYFGNMADEHSLVAKLATLVPVHGGCEDEATVPHVLYL